MRTSPDISVTSAAPYERLFERNIGIYSQEMQSLLRASCIAIAGAGGPGGIAAATLARNGLGAIKLADPDIYEDHNTNRQYGALASTIGRKKVDVMGDILRDINPHMRIETFDAGAKPSNLEEFIRGADLIIDAIDYCAPADRKLLYKTAREKGLHVITSPCGGLGSLVMTFDPNGTTMEEAFCYPSDDAAVATHSIPLKKLIGCDITYVTPSFFSDVTKTPPRISTNGSSCVVSAGPVTVDALKILMLRERQRNPNAFPHLPSIPLLVMPLARRIDLWDESKSGIVNVLDIR